MRLNSSWAEACSTKCTKGPVYAACRNSWGSNGSTVLFKRRKTSRSTGSPRSGSFLTISSKLRNRFCRIGASSENLRLRHSISNSSPPTSLYLSARYRIHADIRCWPSTTIMFSTPVAEVLDCT